MKYVTGVAIMLALTAVVDFPWFAAGLSALLAWLTNLPGAFRERFLGVLIYIGLGGALAVLAHFIQGTYWPWLVVMSFFVLAMLNVNAGAVTFFFLVIFAASWGAQGFEVGNAIANQRIFAEFVGVALALIAVTVRNYLGKRA